MRLAPLAVSGLLLVSSTAGAAVTGRVLDADGRPVAGAVVSALAPESEPDAVARRLEGRARPALATAVTAADGGFRFDLPAGPAWVSAARDGHVPALAEARDDEPAVVTLRKAVVARGVVTAGGRPVPRALVVWNAGAELLERTADDGSYEVPDPKRFPAQVTVVHPDFAVQTVMAMGSAAPLAVKLAPGVAVSGTATDEARRPVAGAEIWVDALGPLARSDARGGFRVPHAPRTWSRVVARTGTLVGVAERRSGDLAVTLRPARSITGTVTDASTRRPLAGATVMVGTSIGPVLTATDARGGFRLTGLEAGHHRPQALRTGYKPGPGTFAHPDGLDLRTRLTTRLDVALEPLERVAGRVVDEGGAPVANAIVDLWFKDSASLYVRSGPLSDNTSAVRSAPDGTFTLLVPDLDEEMPGFGAALLQDRPVVALKEGYAAGHAVVAKGAPTVVTLTRGVELGGRVTGPDGAPLADVEVAAAEEGNIMGSFYPSHLVLAMVDQGWVRTDANGRFSFRVRPQVHHLSFHAAGFARHIVRGHDPAAPLEVALEPAAVLRGRFSRSDGTGIAGAAVNAEAEGMLPGRGGTATTDDDGRFEIGDLAPGLYRVQLHHAALGFHETRTVEAPAAALDVVLAPGGTVRGQVLDAKSRQPVPRYQVWISPAAGEDSWRQVEVEDAAGGFAVSDVPFGDVTLWVRAEGYVQQATDPLTVEAGVDLAPVEVLLDADAPVAGRVVDRARQPVAGARIAEVKGDRHEGAVVEVTSDTNGEFELRGLAPGEVEIGVQARGFATAKHKVDTRETTRLEVTLERGLTLRGEVVRNGAGVAGAHVGAFSKGGDSQSSQTDAQGRFAIEGLSLGRYNVSVFAGNRHVSREDVDPATAGLLRLSLDGQGTAVVVGRIVGLPPDEGAVVFVNVGNTETSESAQTMVESGHEFRVTDAPVGRVSIQAHAMSMTSGLQRTSRTLELDLAPGSTTEAVIEFGADVTVSGVVVRDAAGLPFVNVAFRSEDGTSATARTDAAGAYRVDGLAPGRYAVDVSGDKLAFSTTLALAGTTTFDIDVTGSTLRGRAVRAEDGAPVAGVEVALFRLGVDENTPHASATSSVQGVFERRDLPEGRYRLITSKAGFGQEVVELDVLRGGAADVVVELRPSSGLQLKVVDARDGRALDAIVVVRDAAKRIVANRHGGVGQDGTFNIALADGAYVLSTSASGYGTATLPVTAPATGLKVALTPGGTLVVESATPRHGKVRLLQPNGDEYVRCWCNGIADIELKGRRTTIENVTPGAYTLEVVDDPSTRHPVVVREGQTSTVTMD